MCNFCKKVYESKDSLRMHKDEPHGEPRFPCPHCELMFKSANLRWYHKNKVHTFKDQGGHRKAMRQQKSQ